MQKLFTYIFPNNYRLYHILFYKICWVSYTTTMLTCSRFPCHFITVLWCLTHYWSALQNKSLSPTENFVTKSKKFFSPQVATIKGHSLARMLSQGCVCNMPQHSQFHNRSLEKIKHWIIQCCPSWHSCEMCIHQHRHIDNMHVFQFLLEQQEKIHWDTLG